MRKCLLLVLLFVCFTVQLRAQGRIGIKSGVNAATASSALFAENARLGMHLGVFRHDPLSKRVSLRSELLYSQKGWKFSYFDPSTGLLDLSFRLNYLEGVVALHWKIHPKVAIYPGMQLSALLSYHVLVKPGHVQAEYENPSRLEFAPLIGTNIQVSNHWSTDLRFSYGTWSIEGWPVSKSAVLMWSVEYTL